MWTRKELKEQGKAAVKRNYWKTVFVSAIATAILGGAGVAWSTSAQNSEVESKMMDFGNTLSGLSTGTMFAIIALVMVIALIAIACVAVAKVIITNPLEVGVHKFLINAKNDRGNISDLGNGFDCAYKRNVGTLFLRDLYIILWSLLFIIPGIVKSYEYRMIPYILADNPDMNRKEAFEKSRAMMRGNKWKTFVLDISFILWDILGTITAGIVTVLYVLPYRYLTDAALYEALKNN